MNFLSGFPKSPPADMMEPKELPPPPQPRNLPDRRCSNALRQRASGRAGAELSAPAGPGGAARLDGAGLVGHTHTGSRRRLPAESPSTKRDPQLRRERRAVSRCSRLASSLPSTPRTKTGVRGAECDEAGAADASGTFHTQRLGSDSCRRRSPTC